MANTYKNIVITPNISSNTADPKVVFSGGNTTTNTDITLYVYPDSNGSLSWEGSAGQLFSITNDLSNNIFGVNDVSGIPYIEVYANGLVSVAQYGGNVVIGNTAEFILTPGAGLWANSSVGTAGQVLTSNASSVYWRPSVTNAASVALTTQSTVDFTGIPSWVRKITVLFHQVSLSGGDKPLLQLGTSGGFVTTGYQSYESSGGTSTSGILIPGTTSTDTRSGSFQFFLIDGVGLWVCTGLCNNNGGSISSDQRILGIVNLAAALTQVRLTRTGTNTFDGGTVNIFYE